MNSIFNASEVFDRKPGFPSQQRCINDHKFPVKLRCTGRSGRDPRIMNDRTIWCGLLLNGAVPVKTCLDVSGCQRQPRAANIRQINREIPQP